METDKLILCVQKRKPLWNQTTKEYHNRDIVKNLWLEIGKELQVPSELAKIKWRGIRDNFRRELVKTGGSKKSRWIHFDSMLFLKESLSTKEKTNKNDKPVKKEKMITEKIPIKIEKKLEKKKINQFKKNRDETKVDSDYHFLVSLHSYLKKVPIERKMLVRMKMQNIFVEEEELRLRQTRGSSNKTIYVHSLSPNSATSSTSSPQYTYQQQDNNVFSLASDDSSNHEFD